MLAVRPQSQRTKNIVIGKGENWRDRTHFRSSYGIAWADILCQFPLMAAGSIGTLLGLAWGYILWAAVAAIAVWGSIVLWFSEREYVYPAWGAFAYYTFVWGFFVYWGLAVLVYAMIRIVGYML